MTISSHCVFVETNLETRLVVLVHNEDKGDVFKEKLCIAHKQCFPEVGDITISTLKVKRKDMFFRLSDSFILSKAFHGNVWFLYVDAALKVAEESKLTTTNVVGEKENSLTLKAKEETTKQKKRDDDKKSSRIKVEEVEFKPPSSACVIVQDTEKKTCDLESSFNKDEDVLF